MLDAILLTCWLNAACQTYGVEPEFATAVMRLESGTRTAKTRLGRLGRTAYAGPFGLHIAYVREKFGVDATNPYVNVLVGVRALRGTRTDAAKIKRLKNYNKTWWKDNYIPDVLATYRQLKRQR